MSIARVFENLEKSLDNVFAQKIKFTPILKRESVSSMGVISVDPDRAEKTVDCVFETSFVKYQLGRGFRGARNDSFNAVVDDHPYCLLRKSSLPYELAKGDQVQRVETGEYFSIADIKPDELGRILIELHNIGVSMI